MEGKLEVLMSSMYQTDVGLAYKSNVQTDLVLVNQCDRESNEVVSVKRDNGKTLQVKFICTKERGLSRSRNMAIRNATADICLLADDDEVFIEGYEDYILTAFEEHPEADIIAFGFLKNGKPCKMHKPKVHSVGRLGALRVSSVQIAFRRKKILGEGICFDEEMGAGSGHGAGEENKFLYDCLKKKLRIIYMPSFILTLKPRTTSTWFTGYNRQFMLQKGWETQRYMGKFKATLYGMYTVVAKYPIYKKNCSMPTALKAILTGIYRSNTIFQN